jgi:hypothetical protein
VSRPHPQPTAGGSRGASAASLSAGPVGRPVCASGVSSFEQEDAATYGWRLQSVEGFSRSNRADRNRSSFSTSASPLFAALSAALARATPKSLSTPAFASMRAWLRAKVSSSSTAIRISASLRRVSRSEAWSLTRFTSHLPSFHVTLLPGSLPQIICDGTPLVSNCTLTASETNPTAGGSRGASAAPLSAGPVGRPVCASGVSSLVLPPIRFPGRGPFPQRRARLVAHPPHPSLHATGARPALRNPLRKDLEG